jgi:zinc and cadmium transporter
MNLFLYVLVFSLLGSVGALIGAGILYAFPAMHERLKGPLLSYAIGTLLGAAFLALLPESIESLDTLPALQVVLAGFVAFFMLEKIIRVPHSHAHSEVHPHMRGHLNGSVQPVGILILIGDAFHNLVDGILIATAFSISASLGIATALAIVAHEIPQELGDFVILTESGMPKMKAYWANFASALATVLGAMLTLWFRESIASYSPYIIAIAASSFLYIAAVDLSPILHHYTDFRSGIKQTAGICAGILTIYFIHTIMAH